MHHLADEGTRRVLGLTFAKRKHDRFDADFKVSAFTPERQREIRAEELACERADARREERYGSEE